MIDVIEKAHLVRDLRLLLIPYATFRAYFIFKGQFRRRKHFYGDEHQCTYNQLLFGQLPHIVMKKIDGYDRLIKMAERDYVGQYTHAKIYMRDPSGANFSTLCRHYADGVLQLDTKNDPLLADDEGYIINYDIFKGRVIISEKPKEEVNFKQLVNEQLNQPVS